MQEFFHQLTINGRSGITVTGVESVAAFSETQIVLVLVSEKQGGKVGERVTVTGEGLKITGFSKTSGTFSASGVVGGVRYGGQGLKARLFR
jgi:hypothetical protein